VLAGVLTLNAWPNPALSKRPIEVVGFCGLGLDQLSRGSLLGSGIQLCSNAGETPSAELAAT